MDYSLKYLLFLTFPPLFVLLIFHLFLSKSRGQDEILTVPAADTRAFSSKLPGNLFGIAHHRNASRPFSLLYVSLPLIDRNHHSGQVVTLQSTAARNYLKMQSDTQQDLKSQFLNQPGLKFFNYPMLKASSPGDMGQ